MKPPLLDLRHLQMIAMLATTSRVTDAAERLGITPSALSHRIREAERRLGVPLFTRVHKRLRMTPSAEYLAQVADRLLADLARAEDDVRRMNGGVEHVVRLAVEAYSSYHWLPTFVRHLRAAEEGIGLQVVAAATRNPVDGLADRAVDLAIVSGAKNRPGAELTHLFDDELLFIMAPDHRLAGRPYINGEDVVGEDFITYTRVPEPDREYARLFRPSDTFPNWTATVELPEAIVELVAAGLGTSVLAGWAVQSSIRSRRILGARVGPQGLSVSWYAATRPGNAKEDRHVRRVARHLAAWTQATGGFLAREDTA
jgi:LysR family transcriptional regulator for metE and metH